MVKNGNSRSFTNIGKRGSSHFEIIVSFVLFTGFTLFLVLSLAPTKQTLLEDSILFGVKNSFFDSATTNVTSVLVDISKTIPINCGDSSLVTCFSSELSDLGNKIFTRPDSTNFCRYYLLASQEFSTDLVTMPCLNVRNYSLGYIEKQQVLSNATLQEIKEQYYSDYNASKFRFGVPEVVDFAISSDNFVLTKNVPDDAEVIAGTYRKRVLYGNGSIVNQDFIIRVW